MTTAESTPQYSPEGKSKGRKIYPMTDEIYERGEEVFWAAVRRRAAEKAAKKAAEEAARQAQG